MNNNDIFRRLRYNFNFNDDKVVALFALADCIVTREQVKDWLKNEDDATHVIISDFHLSTFLNGLIYEKRGKKEEQLLVAEHELNNNQVLKKLKIALNLKDTDMQQTLALAGKRVSKHEISAFFRNPKQSQYRICQDQILRNFIHGMQIQMRGK
jgi:uncharacterized protein YehS (DUF1456 family)